MDDDANLLLEGVNISLWLFLSLQADKISKGSLISWWNLASHAQQFFFLIFCINYMLKISQEFSPNGQQLKL